MWLTEYYVMSHSSCPPAFFNIIFLYMSIPQSFIHIQGDALWQWKCLETAACSRSSMLV